MAASQAGVTVRNWANVYSASPDEYYEPCTAEQVADIVKRSAAANRTLAGTSSSEEAGSRRLVVRVVGAGHSPNDCAMSGSVMMSLKRLNKVKSLDLEKAVVTVEAGITIKDLNEALDKNGLAIPNLGSISDQSIAGAIATGTHGTGATLGSLSSMVTALTLVDGQGRVVKASPNDPATSDLFHAALVSFGCLGVVVELTLQVVPAFDLETVENEVSLPEVLSTIDRRARSAQHYRFWWFPHTNMCTEWRGNPVQPVVHREASVAERTPGITGFLLRAYQRHVKPMVDWFWGMLIGFHLLQLALWVGLYFPSVVPLINELWRKMLFSPQFSFLSLPLHSKTEAAASAGRGSEVAESSIYKRRTDRSDRCFNFNCLFQQHVDEWAIPAEHLPQALLSLQQVIGSLGQRAHFPVEVRFVAEDSAWLSPCHGRALNCYIGIIAYKPYGVESEYKRYFHAFEREMRRWGGRPHWAKDFHLRGDRDFAPLYPRWHDFKTLRARMDPYDVFVNAFVERVVLDITPKGGAEALSPYAIGAARSPSLRSPSTPSRYGFPVDSPASDERIRREVGSGAGAMPSTPLRPHFDANNGLSSSSGSSSSRSTTPLKNVTDEEAALRRRTALGSPRV